MSTGDVVAKIRKYIGQLKDEEKIGHALGRLQKIDMNMGLLMETGIGKEVNRFRNHVEFGDKAQKLVEKWRKLASVQAESMNEAESNPSPKERKRHMEDDEELKSTNQISFADALKAPIPAPKKIRIIVKEPEPPKSEFIPKNFVPSVIEEPVPDVDPAMFSLRKGKPMKIYAGRKQTKTVKKVDSLYNLAMIVCMQNVDYFTHGPLNTVYSVFYPVLARCTPEQLERVEHYNPHIEEDSDELWKTICLKNFPKSQKIKDEDESWKQCYKRQLEERDARLKEISNKIKKDNKQEQMVTKMSDAITPANIRRRQLNHFGTVVPSYKIPHAIEVTKARREIFHNGAKAGVASIPAAMRIVGIGPTAGSSRSGSYSSPSSNGAGPKKGALMQKTLKMMKSRMKR